MCEPKPKSWVSLINGLMFKAALLWCGSMVAAAIVCASTALALGAFRWLVSEAGG
jgi:hypothetical protein